MMGADVAERSTSSEDDAVELVIPASPKFLRLAKRVAQYVGATFGCTLVDLDDIAIAVTTACELATMEAARASGQGATLRLRFTEESGALNISIRVAEARPATASHVPPTGEVSELSRVGMALIRCLVDSARLEPATGHPVAVRLVKRLR